MIAPDLGDVVSAVVVLVVARLGQRLKAFRGAGWDPHFHLKRDKARLEQRRRPTPLGARGL
jgi:hypothetical protein